MAYIRKKNYEYFNLEEKKPLKVSDLNNMEGITASSGSMPDNVGEKGSLGPKGLIGPLGPTGPALGDEGPMGPIGQRGPQGPMGIQGKSGINSTIRGSRGAIGVQGNVGSEGIKGILGVKGRDGPIGPIGERGPPGDLPIDNTPPPPEGPKGKKGDIGIKGMLGDKGPPGPIGPAGKKGAIGPIGITGNNGNTGKGIAALFGQGTEQEINEVRDIITPYMKYSANGNIGINNVNPNRKLHVSNVNNPYNIVSLETDKRSIDIGVKDFATFTTDSDNYFFNKQININGDIHCNDNVGLITEGQERISINKNSVGIGKKPTDTLDINGTLKGTTICIGSQCMDENKLKKMLDYISIPRESGCIPCKCNYNSGGYNGTYTSCGTLDNTNYWKYGPMTCHDPSFTNGILKFKSHGSCPGIKSLSFTVDHKDQGWGNRCSYYGMFMNDGSKNHGANFSANRGGWKTSSHTIEFKDPKPIYKPGQGKIWLRAGGHWPGCAIYLRNPRNIKLTMSDGSVINISNFPGGSYSTGRGRSKNHGEQASAPL